MILYLIRHKTTGLYSSGGNYPSWKKNGKVWTSRGALSGHFAICARAPSTYKDAEILMIDVADHASQTLNLQQWLEDTGERRKERELRQREAQAAWRRAQDEKQLADLAAKLGKTVQ